jgi:hypothetical protein
MLFQKAPREFFIAVRKESGLSWGELAASIKVNVRTITSWRVGETTVPASVIEKWSKQFKIKTPLHENVDLNEQRAKAASLGGFARFKKYGDLGTSGGRKRGGLQAQQTHKQMEHSPFVARDILRPRRSELLAELVGAILGDGSLTKYQLVLYSNLITDREYSDFLSSLIEKIFGVVPSMTHHPLSGVTRVLCSSKNIVDYLQSIGLGLGNKTRRQASVPSWILKNRSYIHACMRGLIDTDGCVYIDHHKTKCGTYESVCIAFTNASKPLLDFVFEAWESLGFHPTRQGRHVRLRRSDEVIRHAKEVGFNNPKHFRKIKVK